MKAELQQIREALWWLNDHVSKIRGQGWGSAQEHIQKALDALDKLEAQPSAKVLTDEVWPYLQHKDGCRAKSFANSMMSHAPMNKRTCTCGLDLLRTRLNAKFNTSNT